MWPAASLHSSEDTVDDKMVGVLCNERIKAKCSIGNQHQERKHPKSKVFSEGKRLRILGFYESNLSRQQTTMRHAMHDIPFALGHEMSVSAASEGTVEVEDLLDNPNPNNVSVPISFSLHLPAITSLLTSPNNLAKQQFGIDF